MVDDIIDNINKFHSLNQLEKYYSNVENLIGSNSNLNTFIPHTILNDFNFRLKNKFPDSFGSYKSKYFQLNEKISRKKRRE